MGKAKAAPTPHRAAPMAASHTFPAKHEQRQAGSRGGHARPEHGHPAVPVDDAAAEEAHGCHGQDKEREEQGAGGFGRAEAVHGGLGDPVVARPFGQGGPENHDADQQGAAVPPGGRATAPRLASPSAGTCGACGGGSSAAPRRSARPPTAAMTSRCCGRPTPSSGKPRADQRTQEGPAAEGRMELGHDRSGGVGARRRPLRRSGTRPTDRRPCRRRRARRRYPGTDSASSESAMPDTRQRRQQAAGADAVGRADPADDMPGGGKRDQRADGGAQQQRAHLPGRDVQDLGDRRNAGRPAGEDQAVGAENDERGHGCGGTCRPAICWVEVIRQL